MILEPKRIRSRSLIDGAAAGDESSGDRQAERVNDPSNERCADAGHREHQSPARRRGTAERMQRGSRGDRATHYDMKVRPNHRVFAFKEI